MRRKATVAIVATALLAVTGCATTAPEAAVDSITIALSADPSGLDPQLVQDGNALAVYGNISETLVFRADDGELVEGLALSWENIDDTTWQFALRPDVEFSNGEPFDAEAVVHSIERIIDPEFATQQSGWLGSLSGAEAVDDLTVNITTSEADPRVPSRMALITIVPPVASEEEGFGSAPVGTGPYVLDSWTRGGDAVLSVNDGYWGDAPEIQSITFRPVTDATVRLASLESGELDLVSGLLPEQIDQAPQVVQSRGLEFPTIILDTRDGAFADVRVRQAANYAVDKQALLDGLYGGYGSIASCQMIGPDVFGFNPELEAYDYDPEKAKELLAEAGQPAPKVTFIGDATNRWLKDAELVQSVASYLTEVGFEVDVQLLDFGAFLDELLAPENTAETPREDLYFIGHGNDSADADVTYTAFYASTGIDSSASNPEMDAMIEAGRSELDADARESTYQEIAEIGCDEANFIFLLNLDNTYGLSETLDWAPRVDGQILVKTMSLK